MKIWSTDGPEVSPKYLPAAGQDQRHKAISMTAPVLGLCRFSSEPGLLLSQVFFWARFSSGGSLGLGIYGWGECKIWPPLAWQDAPQLQESPGMQTFKRAVWMTGSNRFFNLQLHLITHSKPFLPLIAYFASAFSFFLLAFPASPTHCKHCNKLQNKTQFWSQTSKCLHAQSLNCLDDNLHAAKQAEKFPPASRQPWAENQTKPTILNHSSYLGLNLFSITPNIPAPNDFNSTQTHTQRKPLVHHLIHQQNLNFDFLWGSSLIPIIFWMLGKVSKNSCCLISVAYHRCYFKEGEEGEKKGKKTTKQSLETKYLHTHIG